MDFRREFGEMGRWRILQRGGETEPGCKDEIEVGEACGREAETTLSISVIKATLALKVEGQTGEGMEITGRQQHIE